MLPDAQRQPPGGLKAFCRVGIAGSVSFNFLSPVASVGARDRVMERTAVPEAAVDEYSHPDSRKHQIRRPAQVGYRSAVDEISHASSVEFPTKCELRLGVTAAVASHAGSDSRR